MTLGVWLDSLRRGGPLKKIFAAYSEPIEGASDGIDHEARLMREKYQVCASNDEGMGKISER